MIRNGLDANAQHASLVVSPGKGLAFQRRAGGAGSASVSTPGPLIAAPVWLKLGVRGTTITAYYRKSLTDLWTVLGQQTFTNFAEPTAGLAVSSHVDGTVATARFSAVDFRQNLAWSSADLGGGGGSIASDGVITSVTGKGTDIWGTSDQFQFAYAGWGFLEGAVTARVRSVQNVNAWTKAGVMFREQTAPAQAASARYVFVMVTPGKGVTMQYRSAAGGAAASLGSTTGAAPGWVRISKIGETYTGSWSKDGVVWTSLGSISMTRFAATMVGLAVTSHNSATAATASFDDVKVDDAHRVR